MQMALGLARRGLGNVWPNPAVGCVLVKDGQVIARGWTQPGGRPHAEMEALARAGDAAKGATAYVTLEPCAHEGKTPSCARSLANSGIARVVVAVKDPDDRTNGAGIAILKEAGIEVAVGVCEVEARALNAGFFKRIEQRMPYVALKYATTLDGRIALRSGDSQWITGAPARGVVHRLRAQYDAILVGSSTVYADDPMLTCRLPGLEGYSPVRVVLDSRLIIDENSRLVASAKDIPLWVITLERAVRTQGKKSDALLAKGVKIFTTHDTAGHVDLSTALATLAQEGITRVFIEGGAQVATAVVKERLMDRVYWFRAATMMGEDGLPAVAHMGLERMEALPHFSRTAIRPVGDDILEVYEAAAGN
ncbi:MAG: bifunctional diaminohydroxyphosphoribosylaminopyrimidine deaminase/5-amino-6-(5-phosphoribosylamino)uracil reductase RibD [Alphaproteobacteria bacterium]|nr:bifunctional diaminohydroxyphosphoribosylaminopyrimidine deaminase/5-amino-6-(5-phosphoribosylamino)uracil reductase RibD [Alphaproteobacteria bacterium]